MTDLADLDRALMWTEDASPGRRLRVFAILNRSGVRNTGTTYGQWMAEAATGEDREKLAHLPLRTGGITTLYEAIPEAVAARDADLHIALAELADEIAEDISEAAAALDDPWLYYPGIDEGIPPVPDAHVELVIWALQRELNRETRFAQGKSNGVRKPPIPLKELPFNVQRALAERRRWRYAQYGIGRAQWLANEWSLWDIPEDPLWQPRRQLRLAASSPAVAPEVPDQFSTRFGA